MIGCAPTALEELLTLDADPALVIGLPVGFVGAAESKAALRDSGLPSATCPRRAARRSPPPRSTPCCTTPQPRSFRDHPVRPLIAGHGTRDAAGAEAFRDFVRQLGRRHPELPVAGGFIELSPPPLGDAVTELVEQGVRRFAAVR